MHDIQLHTLHNETKHLRTEHLEHTRGIFFKTRVKIRKMVIVPNLFSHLNKLQNYLNFQTNEMESHFWPSIFKTSKFGWVGHPFKLIPISDSVILANLKSSFQTSSQKAIFQKFHNPHHFPKIKLKMMVFENMKKILQCQQ